MRYEDMLATPVAAFSSLAAFLKLKMGRRRIKEAVRATSFGNLRRLEDEKVSVNVPRHRGAFPSGPRRNVAHRAFRQPGDEDRVVQRGDDAKVRLLEGRGGMSVVDVAGNLEAVMAEIGAAARQARRQTGSVTLVAVTKTLDAQYIRPAIDAGHRVFGENRVQEAASKWPALRQERDGLELHLIGALQTNKAVDAVTLFDVIESVDRPR